MSLKSKGLGIFQHPLAQYQPAVTISNVHLACLQLMHQPSTERDRYAMRQHCTLTAYLNQAPRLGVAHFVASRNSRQARSRIDSPSIACV